MHQDGIKVIIIIIITFNSYTKYNRTYQIQKCNIIEHNIKEITEYKWVQMNIAPAY